MAIVPKGSRMWRFLLAGLGTVVGMALLFVGSFGDPATMLRELRPAAPVEHAPVSPGTSDSPASAAQAPEASAGRAENTGGQRQRDALRQLRDAQASLAQATQETATLREQDEQARRELENLREQRAADQAALEQARLEAQRDAEARQRRATEAEKQAAVEQPAPRQTQPVEPPAEVKPPANVKAPSEVKAPAEAKAPLELKVVAPPRPVVGAPTPPRSAQPTAKPAPAEPDAREAVLARLRRVAPSRVDAATAQTVPDPPPRAVQAAPDPPHAASPRQRLMDARTALAAGRTEEAQHLLEQAQAQLVLRPVSPSQGAAVGGSVAAGQVAEALSMLGAGDVLHAIRYINLAVAQADQGPTFATAAPAQVGGAPPPRNWDDYYYGR
jgi:hypothetical protein